MLMHVMSAPVSSCEQIVVVTFLEKLGGSGTLCFVISCVFKRHAIDCRACKNQALFKAVTISGRHTVDDLTNKT